MRCLLHCWCLLLIVGLCAGDVVFNIELTIIWDTLIQLILQHLINKYNHPGDRVTWPIYRLKQKHWKVGTRLIINQSSRCRLLTYRALPWDMQVGFLPPNHTHVEPLHVRCHHGMPTSWVIIPCPFVEYHSSLLETVEGGITALGSQFVWSPCLPSDWKLLLSPDPYYSCKKLLCADQSWLRKTPNWNIPHTHTHTQLVFLYSIVTVRPLMFPLNGKLGNQ